jgi:hypothetical protein
MAHGSGTPLELRSDSVRTPFMYPLSLGQRDGAFGSVFGEKDETDKVYVGEHLRDGWTPGRDSRSQPAVWQCAE